MERVVSMKSAWFLVLFIAAFLLPSCLMAQMTLGPDKKQVFMTGQLCKSHDDCKPNSVYSTNFCVNKISGSEIGHCAGHNPTSKHDSEMELKKSKPKKGTCGKCKTSADCKYCVPTAACETLILDHVCA